jgi:uncharacterized protein
MKKIRPIMFLDITRYRKLIFAFFALAFVTSIYFISTLRFSFDFEQYFPQGDPDLIFFQDFIKNFESDDNFLLVGVKSTSGTEGVFQQDFLQRFDSLTEKAVLLPYVSNSQSLTNIKMPIKSIFGISTAPILHVEDTAFYAYDRARILQDERFVRNLISEDGTCLVVLLKTKEKLKLDESEVLMQGLDSLIKPMGFQEFHYLGRANFQKELVYMEKREVAVSTAIAAILVGIIMAVLFRRWRTVVIALVSIGLAMVLFFGILGAWGRDITAIAALYPVLLVIIGTCDVVHMLSKYIDELRRGHSQVEAMWLTIKEIGLATLMTAITTAIGFATLVTTRIVPIQEFGVNAAVSVLVAYFTVLFFTTSVLSYFKVDDLILLRENKNSGFGYIERFMGWIYNATKFKARQIALIALATLFISAYGISKIGTNYTIAGNMPNRMKVTEDFHFFEKIFSGFRPLEYAVFAQNGHRTDDFEVMQQIDKLETHLRQQPAIRAVTSPTMIYKSLNQMSNGNRADALVLPTDSLEYYDYQRLAENLPKGTANILTSKDGTKSRIATRILDLGADSVMAVGARIDDWILKNTDPSVATFRRTGTGYIIDKNAQYIQADLLEGIAWEVGLIAILMGLMLRNFRMIVIFLIPNLFPMVFAGALVGYLGVPLDAGVSMIFTVVFGISIDDTIHFLSSFNINRGKGQTVDEALKTTLLETGKPVCIATVILFFGFLVMIFSIHPPSVTIGKLIAVTLITALLSDLFINPLLLRWWIKDKKKDN